MDLDLFFSSPRWKILEIIALEPSSPLSISQSMGTSVAYVSQQLKLLEAAGLVKKEKTGASLKGKPRTLYSLAEEVLYISLLASKMPEKKAVHVTEYHKNILRIWLLDNPALHYHVEKFYWALEQDLDEISGMYVDSDSLKPKVIVVSDNKGIKSKVDSFSKRKDAELTYIVMDKTTFDKSNNKALVPIHAPVSTGKEMKGGEIR